jgi:valyl-tRNA synthetase
MATVELPKHYDAQSAEPAVSARWLDSRYFNPDNLPGTRDHRFAMVLPPPNVTGTAHVGHALTVTIEDIMIRFARMRGAHTLWVPGTDHAAIATQSKVEELLYKQEGKTRHDLGREAFLERVTRYAQESHDTIVSQLKRMGCSLDWSREAYTLDEVRSRAVRTAFSRMYDAGLIYRGKRIVNWDPKLQTNVSDDEVEWKDEVVPFYFLQYGPFVIGTARPETKFGDKYVVMHPDDARYRQYAHGQTIELEWINGPVTATIIKDPVIDMSFGTGVMTITPWHDHTDFDIAQRHDLGMEQIIGLDGKLLPVAGDLAGVYIKKARPLIIERLREKGLVVKVDEHYTHRVAVNSRGGGLIEPQIREQWFLAVDRPFTLQQSRIAGMPTGTTTTLKQLMRHVVESGQIRIVPEHFAKTYFHWIDNLRDWCISRQIWFGHRIPVWYRGSDTFCSVEAPTGEGWEQDPDTLDTWFSSGLWSFSTLGWPTDSTDVATYHPLDVMETGYDILFFWVARMILMTGYLLEDVPFRTVYLHGLVRDRERQKMSKSKGNIIDPLTMSDSYGTDALRMALIFATAAGNDIPLAEDRIRGMKHFANKVWNVARFVLSHTPTERFRDLVRPEPATDADRSVLAELERTATDVTDNLTRFVLHESAQNVYQFIWRDFADVYVEAAKKQLEDPVLASSTRDMLAWCLSQSLKLLHPFMPFVTEELWGRIHGTDDPLRLLMVQEWPVVQ